LTNILVFVSDDQRADTLDYMPLLRNRFLPSATLFSGGRVNLSLCQPSRVSIFGGQASIRHGVLNNFDYGHFDHNNTVARWLHDAGYRTGMFGKYMNHSADTGGQQPAPTGWDVWREATASWFTALGYTINDGSSYTTPTERIDDYLVPQAVQFMSGPEPWFCYFATSDPHWPWQADPGDLFAWSDVELPLSLDEDVSTKPSWVRAKPAMTPADVAQFRTEARGQLRELIATDRALSTLLDLAAAATQPTVVIFTSDNGQQWGEHRVAGISSKNAMYEQSMRVPLIASGSGFPAGVSVDAPTWVGPDVTHTVCAIAGVTPGLPEPLAVDLRDVAADPAGYGGRGTLHASYLDATGEGIITATRKLFRYPAMTGSDRYEAYDLDTDPAEITNWANDPSRLSERDGLESRLDALLSS
jgi:N-acetylglucosamine-6-sulfatase